MTSARSFLSKTDIFILCGGFGKRLKKITRLLPKPMIVFGHRPFIEIVIRYLSAFRFKRFVLGIGYKALVVKSYFKKLKAPPKILFSQEISPLGTGGAVKKAKALFKGNTLIVLNGDTFADCDYRKLLEFHRKKKALLTMVVVRVARAKDFGSIELDQKTQRIIHFHEKKSGAKNCFINAGVYVFDRRAFDLMPGSPVFSLERDFYPSLIGKDIYGYIHRGYFTDIGAPGRLREAMKVLPQLSAWRKIC